MTRVISFVSAGLALLAVLALVAAVVVRARGPLADEQRRLAVAIESLADGLMVTDPGSSAIAIVNSRATDLIPEHYPAEREQPTIIFLDVDIPRLGGADACRRMRANPATIVILTAAHGDRIESQAEAAGADLFLTKPFSQLNLLRLVDRLGGESNSNSVASARPDAGRDQASRRTRGGVRRS